MSAPKWCDDGSGINVRPQEGPESIVWTAIKKGGEGDVAECVTGGSLWMTLLLYKPCFS